MRRHTIRLRSSVWAAASPPPPPLPAQPHPATVCCRCLSSLRTAQRRSSAPPRASSSRLPPLNGSLVPTSPPLPRIPPSAPPSDKPVSLRPPHFLKQFYLRVHPDLFHAPFARVQHTALVTDDDDSNGSDQQQQEAAEAISVVTPGVEEVREQEVSSAVMRAVNEAGVARLNELMEYYKQLQSFGEHTPIVAALPRPPSDDNHFAFYCKHSADSFSYTAHRYSPPSTHTPIVALHAIDAFLTRLLQSAGVALPAALVAQWRADWADRRQAHRFGRVKKHMPWMMDESRRAAEARQRETMRRDYGQVVLHASPLTMQQRADYYLRAMYATRLVQVADTLTDEQRTQGTRAFEALVNKHADQLQLEEWLGSVVRIGSEAEGYGWELGRLRLPYNMAPQRVWDTCREYVQALQQAKVGEDSAASAAASETRATAQSSAAEDMERLLNEQWAEQEIGSVREDDPEWQQTAREVRERRQRQLVEAAALADGEAETERSELAGVDEGNGATERSRDRRSGARRKSKLSPAEWARRLEEREEAWLQSKLSEAKQQQHME